MNPRERQVLELISLGYTTAEISQKLFLSSETIKTYRSILMQKMDARNAPHLVCKAWKEGWMS